MRSYPTNSPEAAGRIVALVLLADGNVCRSEFDALDRLGASQALGLSPGALPRLVQSLCEDLLTGLCATGSLLANIDQVTLASLMAEVDDPRLQREVLRLAQAAAAADRHLADGEALVLEAARRHWQLDTPIEPPGQQLQAA
jgi:uncharacterized tellurite resistance protein B-like protein